MNAPHYTDDEVTVWHGDCLDVLRSLPDASVDSVVTDPPYNLSFMAKPWDAYDGHEDAGFAYWLSGLIDGEGHFAIKSHSRGTHAPYFQLKMRADERGTLERIKRSLGVGTLTVEERQPNPMVKYVIQDKAGCQRLVDLLDKYPLRAKKQVDYWTWREAVCEWTSRPRGNRWEGRADNTTMAGLRSRLMENRAYTDVPWSGHEFQDWCRLWSAECLRVLKPGGHMLAFGGTRTWHRLVCAVEDAGFEIRDSIAWLYGSGFPKSLDVSKAIDRLRIEDREPMLRVRAWFNARRLERGMSLGQINALFGLATNGGGNASNWTTHPTNIEIPSWDKWLVLKDALELSDDMDAEVWRLNGRKGSPGEAWEQREKIGTRDSNRLAVAPGQGMDRSALTLDITAPATPEAERWQGWGTALKPAFEPIVVARKPLEGTVAANVLTWGTGALNIDACRIATGDVLTGSGSPPLKHGGMNHRPFHDTAVPRGVTQHDGGRWPANVVLDESQAEVLDAQSGASRSRIGKPRGAEHGEGWGMTATGAEYDDQGGASRFFYVAKAPQAERITVNGVAHPTVKPLALMRWLVRLVTPPGGTVLEPFAGSGTTVEACIAEGFTCVAIERDESYLPLISARILRRGVITPDPVRVKTEPVPDQLSWDMFEGVAE